MILLDGLEKEFGYYRLKSNRFFFVIISSYKHPINVKRFQSAVELEQERVHEVRWVHPETGAVRIYRVAGERDWEICLTAILSDPAPLRGRSILSEALAQDSGAPIYQIHIHGKEEQGNGTA